MKDHINAPKLSLEETFLKLATYTTPYGYEAWGWHLIPGFQVKDAQDNISVLVRHPDGSMPTVMFTSHLDTACSNNEKVSFRFCRDKGEKYIFTDGTTILGADCKIGAALMIQMIHAKVPGWYMFFAGEERGCIGSSWLAERPELWALEQGKVNQCVSFDRYGEEEVITYQGWGNCCSDAYAFALAERLSVPGRTPLAPSANGVYTDSAQFVDYIPECTNISVGYDNHHTNKEYLNITYAEDLLKRLLKCDWETLPIKREAGEDDGGYFGMYGYDYSKRYQQTEDEIAESLEEGAKIMICDECSRCNVVSYYDYHVSDILTCENPTCGHLLDPNGTVFDSDELTEDEIKQLKESNNVY